MEKFIITRNCYLSKNVNGYFNCYYTGYGNLNNPNYLNVLKNTFNGESYANLNNARTQVENILIHDIPLIMLENKLTNCVLLCIPRAKALETYSVNQLCFVQAVKNAAQRINGVIDGVDYITRVKNTKTTHLANSNISLVNDGDMPYPGITENTCCIEKNMIKDKTVILVDDIYTRNVNIDEDCIQALINAGAKEVLFYAVAYTRREQ